MSDITSAFLKSQWTNPTDIFTILLIIGGDVVQVAIGQLCGGPIPFLAPVAFSFGWVSYAVLSLLAVVGDNRLMPKPESPCLLINADSGYARSNYSWVLSRLLRDFEYWRHDKCDDEKHRILTEMRAFSLQRRAALTMQLRALQEPEERIKLESELRNLPNAKDVRIGIRITVWKCKSSSSRGSGDAIYWAGLLVSITQLALAVVPWIIWYEFFTFLATISGTVLAYLSGALSQWAHEKMLASTPHAGRLQESRRYLLTKGNGAGEVIVVLCGEGQINWEALASSQRDLPRPLFTRFASGSLAVLWVGFLISVAGWSRHTWFMVGIGLIGMVQNIIVAAMPRQPAAWGVDLEYQRTIVARKVMFALWELEAKYPGAGLSLLTEFFPGDLRPREVRVWNHARARYRDWKENGRPVRIDGVADIWALAPLYRPDGRDDDWDVPEMGEYGLCDTV